MITQDWDDNGPPSIFWLSGFFFVQSFLTAGLQNYARKHKIPIDMVEYDHVMLQTDPSIYAAAPEEGFYVHGLYLEGCQWDEEKLQLRESSPKVSLTTYPSHLEILLQISSSICQQSWTAENPQK